MAEFHHRLRLDVSPEVAWAVVGNLAGVDTWIPGVTDVKIEGDVRICTFANGAVQQEEQVTQLLGGAYQQVLQLLSERIVEAKQ